MVLDESLSAKLGPPLYSSLRVSKNVGTALGLTINLESHKMYLIIPVLKDQAQRDLLLLN
ncbi:hypothetical protein Hanom_Chr11g01053301 [Helianthus anomalus]